MKLDVQVCVWAIGQLYRERDEYVLNYLPCADRAPCVADRAASSKRRGETPDAAFHETGSTARLSAPPRLPPF